MADLKSIAKKLAQKKVKSLESLDDLMSPSEE
jgi:hypothetical protein